MTILKRQNDILCANQENQKFFVLPFCQGNQAEHTRDVRLIHVTCCKFAFVWDSSLRDCGKGLFPNQLTTSRGRVVGSRYGIRKKRQVGPKSGRKESADLGTGLTSNEPTTQ